jgi:hypothetical protein
LDSRPFRLPEGREFSRLLRLGHKFLGRRRLTASLTDGSPPSTAFVLAAPHHGHIARPDRTSAFVPAHQCAEADLLTRDRLLKGTRRRPGCLLWWTRSTSTYVTVIVHTYAMKIGNSGNNIRHHNDKRVQGKIMRSAPPQESPFGKGARFSSHCLCPLNLNVGYLRCFLRSGPDSCSVKLSA